MARWLQSTVQGMLNAELSDTTIPCADAKFSKAGDPRYFWTEHIRSHGEDISLTCSISRAAAHPLAAEPDSQPALRRMHCVDPALGTRLVRNGAEAKGRSWPRSVKGGPLDVGVGISESWTKLYPRLSAGEMPPAKQRISRGRAMIFPRRGFLQLAAGTVVLAAFVAVASAQTYPSRPITLVGPFPRAGPADVLARILAETHAGDAWAAGRH